MKPSNQRIGSTTRQPTEARKALLFKFSGLDNYSLENLDRGTIVCRHCSQFDGLLEFRTLVRQGAPARADHVRFAEVLRALGESYEKYMSPENIELHFAELENNQPDIDHILRSARVSCFGSDSSNLLMWSRYAESLRGFCIGFDPEVLLSTGVEATIMNVIYCEFPPVVDSFIFAIFDEAHSYCIRQLAKKGRRGHDDSFDMQYAKDADHLSMEMKLYWQKILAAKPSAWAAEAEVRLLIDGDPQTVEPTLFAFPPEAVTQLILGEHMPDKYKDCLIDIVKRTYQHVKIQYARQEENAYNLLVI